MGDFTTQRFFKLPGHEPVRAVKLQPRQGLANVTAKLKAEQNVTVAVFAGGNHAQGQWTATVGKWPQAQYPAAKLTIINSPIHGGFRGSGLSVFQLGHDVLSHRPDLLMVDFAADDFESSEESVQANAEGMVRQAWKTDPSMDVMFVYAFRPASTSRRSNSSSTRRTAPCPSRPPRKPTATNPQISKAGACTWEPSACWRNVEK